MTTVTSSGEAGNKSDPISLNYDPDTYGRMLMSKSMFQPTGVSYAARTEIERSDSDEIRAVSELDNLT